MPDLSSKVFIVTGASRGIGFATARLLADDGARVALFARDADAVAEAARSISQSAIGGASIGGTAIGVAVDVGEHGPMLAAFQSVWDAFGRLDGVVNNAGATMVCRIEHLSEAAVMLQVKANFLGVVYGSQAAIPYLRRTGGGRIVNVTSATARHPEEFPHLSIYAATKAAAERFTFELRDEVKADKIGVTAFSPGTTATTFGAAASAEEAAAGYQRWLEMGPDCDSMMETDTVAQAIVNCLTAPAGAAFDFVELRPNRPTSKAMRI
jgi:NAD(P)-dependent dehydrogenase (short-subunit alcohol dehydrogenase family)